MYKIFQISTLSLLVFISCTSQESSIIQGKNALTGRWDVKFYLNNIEQTTTEPYFWTFGADSTFTYSNKNINTENQLISWNLNANKYKIIPLETYKKLSIDYELSLNNIGITESDCKYVFDLGNHQLSVIYSGNNAYQILGLPLGVKQYNESSIILFPLVKNKSFEIRLTKK
jgi:hypothetical protein